ncbi:MAG: hypothetical protein QM493_08640 [Sulfurovum sp.]
MKKIIYILLVVSSLLSISQATTLGDAKIIEASENIRYLSQIMAKNYIFYYLYPQKKKMVDILNQSIEKLNDNFRMIAKTSKDSDTKDILEFLAYSKEQIKEILDKSPDDETTALMLDYSETIVEGADSISNSYIYKFSKEEDMLMLTKKVIYLLQRVTKYYMAVNSGFDNITNKEQLEGTIYKLDENIATINKYKYPKILQKEIDNMNISWRENRTFLSKSKNLFIPVIMFVSISYLENIVNKLSLHHSKNQ